MGLVMIEKHDKNPESPRAFRVLVTRRGSLPLCFAQSMVWPVGHQHPTGMLDFSFESPAAEKVPTLWVGTFSGDPPGIRTLDPLLKRQLLYRLS